jgi:DNA repair protein RadC
MACLNDEMYMLGILIFGSGSRSNVNGNLKEIVLEALASRASSVILAHNHPSGDVRPSQTDIKTTRNLVRALHPLSIRLQDHLILSGDRWSSMRGLGLL